MLQNSAGELENSREGGQVAVPRFCLLYRILQRLLLIRELDVIVLVRMCGKLLVIPVTSISLILI